jgi:hypothetical protein
VFRVHLPIRGVHEWLEAMYQKPNSGHRQQPVHSFHTLLADRATMARNTISAAINPQYPLTVVTRPTPVQQKTFDLLGLAL